MTPVIVATLVDDFAYVYWRDDKGGLHQTAQVLVGPVQPIELATIAANLGDNLSWAKMVKSLNGDAPVDADTKAVLTAPKRSRKASPDRIKRSYAEVAAFDDEILGILAEHPGITIPAISELMLNAKDKNSQSSIRAGIERLSKRGKVSKDTNVERGESHRYSAVDHLEGDAGVTVSPVEATSL